jgi:predicted HAD superfamily Cof-like phosphohydrolase
VDEAMTIQSCVKCKTGAGYVLLDQGILKETWLCRLCLVEIASRAGMAPSVDAQVEEFHIKFDQPNRDVPTIPPDDEIRLRVRLVLEEAFEFAEACLEAPHLKRIKAEALSLATQKRWPDCVLFCGSTVRVDIEKAIDALADIDYVVAGSGLFFGVRGGPIADEVHAANMRKEGGDKYEGGKIRKPAGWIGPDIRGALIKQGFVFPESAP